MRVEILSDQEFQVLKDKMLSFTPKFRCMFSFLLFSGLRNAELCQLNCGDVNQSGYIRRSLFLSAKSCKTGVSREVDLPAPVMDSLEVYFKHVAAVGQSAGPFDPLFITAHGKVRITPRDVQRWVHTHTQQAIGRAVWPHVLRHTYATQLLKFTNLRVVQILLGHKSLLSTMIYTHPTSADCSAAVGRAFPCTPESLVLGKGGCNHG